MDYLDFVLFLPFQAARVLRVYLDLVMFLPFQAAPCVFFVFTQIQSCSCFFRPPVFFGFVNLDLVLFLPLQAAPGSGALCKSSLCLPRSHVCLLAPDNSPQALGPVQHIHLSLVSQFLSFFHSFCHYLFFFSQKNNDMALSNNLVIHYYPQTCLHSSACTNP